MGYVKIAGTEMEEIAICTEKLCGRKAQLRTTKLRLVVLRLVGVCYFWLVSCVPNLKTVNYKFLLKGQTHMEEDDALCHRPCKKEIEP